jgi:hypothetical protein
MWELAWRQLPQAFIRKTMPAFNDERPDPDALLARVQLEEQAALRGKLRIYFGSNAGVGEELAGWGATARGTEAEVATIMVIILRWFISIKLKVARVYKLTAA